MLQVIIKDNKEYSAAEQVQMAVEGGARWVELHFPAESYAGMREEIADSIVPLCRDNGVILTVKDNVEVAKEYAMHGVFVTDKNVNVPALRDELGPEAIIGAEVTTPQAARMLENADIDFVRPPKGLSDAEVTRLVAEIRANGGLIAVVAEGEYTAENAFDAMITGVSGLASGPALFAAKDPVQAVSEIIKVLTKE